ncbi:ras-related protein Rap1-like [Ornithodoros turicata]|uniref:ras-related protein Rap1-like n=1 Tax=Ornithodoros turicata TaxID=34597 RepID=UPI0031388F9E
MPIFRSPIFTMPTWCSPRLVNRRPSHAQIKNNQNANSTNENNAPNVLRIAVMGGARVGKSTLIHQFLFERTPSQYESTVEELYRSQYDGNLTLEVLDTSGTFQFPAMRRLAISTADAFILVYALNDVTTFDEVRDLREAIACARPNAPVIVVGNKLDLSSSRHLQREITETVVCVDWECSYVECAAVVGANVMDVFKELMNRFQVQAVSNPQRRRRRSLPTIAMSNKAMQTYTQDSKRNSCILS